MQIRNLKKLAFILAIGLLPLFGLAQDPLPTDEIPVDPAIPFDGGISLLVAAGIGYGVKKAHDKRKKDQQLEDIEK